MSSKAQTLGGVQSHLTKLVASIASVVPAGTTLKIDGVEHTVPEVVAELEHYLGLYTDVESKKSAYEAAVRARKDAQADVHTLLQDLHAALVPVLGKTSVGLETLGFSLPKPRQPLTSEQAKAKADRARKTREQLHTLGSRQKQELKAQLREQSDATTSPADASKPVSPEPGKPGTPTT